MFSSHKPRVYRSSTGCCICGSKSSSSRFTSSEKYEPLFTGCFEIQQGSRCGVICNACVLLVKRWQKLPEGAKRSWGHVVDGKCKSRRNSRRSSAVEDDDPMQSAQTLAQDGENLEKAELKRDDIPGQVQGSGLELSDSGTPLSCSPTLSDISDCAVSDNGRVSTACQTSFMFPQLEQSEMKFPYVDLSGWRREEVCCGTIFKGPSGEVLVDPKLLKPSCHCARSQNRTLLKQNSEET